MKHLAAKLWSDDQGALIATEYLFVATILVIGTCVGLATIREAVNNELGELANAILALSQGYTISGQSGFGGTVDGSQAIDTPSLLADNNLTAPAIPSVIDLTPGN